MYHERSATRDVYNKLYRDVDNTARCYKPGTYRGMYHKDI